VALRLPNFQQTSTRVGPDTSTAELISGLGEAGANLFTGAVRNRTRQDLNKLQGELMSSADVGGDVAPGTDPMELVRLANAIGDERDAAVAEEGGLLQQRGRVHEGVASILTDYDRELSRLQQMQAQGAMTAQEFDIRTRAIRKRMVDRYPGLSPEIDDVYRNHTQYDEGYLRTVAALEAQASAAQSANDEVDRLRKRAETLGIDASGMLSSDPLERASFLRAYADAETLNQNLNQTSNMIALADNLAKMSGEDVLGPTARYGLRESAASRMQTERMDADMRHLKARGQAQVVNRIGGSLEFYIQRQINDVQNGVRPAPDGVRDPAQFKAFLATHEGIVWLDQQKDIAVAQILLDIQSDPTTSVIWNDAPDSYRADVRDMVERTWESRVAYMRMLNPAARAEYLESDNSMRLANSINKELDHLSDEVGEPSPLQVQMAMDPMKGLQVLGGLAETVFTKGQERELGRRLFDDLVRPLVRQTTNNAAAAQGQGGGEDGGVAEISDTARFLKRLPEADAETVAVSALNTLRELHAAGEIATTLPGTREPSQRDTILFRALEGWGIFSPEALSAAKGSQERAEVDAALRNLAGVQAQVVMSMLSTDGLKTFNNLPSQRQNDILDFVGSEDFPRLVNTLMESDPAVARSLLEWGQQESVSNAARARAASLSSSQGHHRALYQQIGPDIFEPRWDEASGSYQMELKPDALKAAREAVSKKPSLGAHFRGLDPAPARERLGGTGAGAFGAFPGIPRTTTSPAALDRVTEEALRELQDRINYSQRNIGRAIKAATNMQAPLYVWTDVPVRVFSVREVYDANVVEFDPVLRKKRTSERESE
jgi:hypothetical protein